MLIVSNKYESLDRVISGEITNESALTNADYPKHNYQYALAIINKLLDGEEVRLGDKGDKGSISGKKLSQYSKDMLNQIKDKPTEYTVNDFNDAVKDLGIKWTSLFKGDVTGYSDGLASKNKGNAFEAWFIEHYDDPDAHIEENIKKIAKYKKRTGEPRADGELNQKRPLTFSGGTITCGPAGNYKIGKTVTDVTVPVDKCPPTGEKEVYLSLKYGNTVTFVNAGIKKLFTEDFFNGGKLKGEGKDLLNMLCIDEKKFREVFTSYEEPEAGKKKKASYATVNVTNKLKSNETFKEFMESVMGYGFILVHQISGTNIEYIDLLTEAAMKHFISDIESATVEYPTGGSAKRVNVVVKYPSIEFSINIRSKDGGVLPTHIMADYKFV